MSQHFNMAERLRGPKAKVPMLGVKILQHCHVVDFKVFAQ